MRAEAGKIIGSGIWLFGPIALAVTAAMGFAAPWPAQAMQAPEAAFAQTVSYIKIHSAGAVFIACVLNIGGDLPLVAGLRMGAAGAAISTVFAQSASVLLSLLIIRRRALPFTFVNALGLTASAGIGAAEKLCGFLMPAPSAYMRSMPAFVMIQGIAGAFGVRLPVSLLMSRRAEQWPFAALK